MQIHGDITLIRELEDCIRSTKRYVKLVKSRHEPSQSNGSPILLFTESYIVYTGNENDLIHNNKKIFEIFRDMYNWFMSSSVTVHFTYNYRDGDSVIRCTNGDIDLLCEVIPGFKETIKKITKKVVNEKTEINL